jgi:hypothetical protein
MLNCNYCDKKGLLIYPVRYAVASPYGAAGVPGLSGNFRIENGPQQIGEARYTLRALRAGYLYTYDERRGWFKAYVVMPTGHLWNFPLHYRPPQGQRYPVRKHPQYLQGCHRQARRPCACNPTGRSAGTHHCQRHQQEPQ